MAKGYLEKLMRQRNIRHVQVSTAGVMTRNGLLPTQESVQMLHEEGEDIRSHRSKPMTSEMLENADLVLGMGAFQVQKATRTNPNAKGKTFLLKEYVGLTGRNAQISDPMGGTMEVYRKVFGELKAAINLLIDKDLFTSPPPELLALNQTSKPVKPARVSGPESAPATESPAKAPKADKAAAKAEKAAAKAEKAAAKAEKAAAQAASMTAAPATRPEKPAAKSEPAEEARKSPPPQPAVPKAKVGRPAKAKPVAAMAAKVKPGKAKPAAPKGRPPKTPAAKAKPAKAAPPKAKPGKAKPPAPKGRPPKAPAAKAKPGKAAPAKAKVGRPAKAKPVAAKAAKVKPGKAAGKKR